jgi:hypothetical protein
MVTKETRALATSSLFRLKNLPSTNERRIKLHPEQYRVKRELYHDLKNENALLEDNSSKNVLNESTKLSKNIDQTPVEIMD